jgi:hypothetical protein
MGLSCSPNFQIGDPRSAAPNWRIRWIAPRLLIRNCRPVWQKAIKTEKGLLSCLSFCCNFDVQPQQELPGIRMALIGELCAIEIWGSLMSPKALLRLRSIQIDADTLESALRRILGISEEPFVFSR